MVEWSVMTALSDIGDGLKLSRADTDNHRDRTKD